ncbi:MAG: M23 family metallopeptidase, partial [Erysipelotrichaceae bacterium]|nr:M23 family metallopeptidase [Erysipelotrichaceae bacterium]
ILTDGEEISSVTTVQPVQEVVRIGTGGYGDDFYYEGGTGSFQWPAKHHKVICGWLCYTGHYAIDIVDRYKTYSTCYAADSGKCIDNSYDSIGGYHITISHGDNVYTYYGHFRQKSAIKVGEYVEKGQAIGRIGMTGYATCPHIHFEIWVEGRPWTAAAHRINPCTQLGC